MYYDWTELVRVSWNEGDRQGLLLSLMQEAEVPYRTFIEKIVPGVQTGAPVLGVRMPVLLKVAKAIGKGNYREFLQMCRREYYEEIIIESLLCTQIRADYDVFLEYAERFLDAITNWAVCDTFASRLLAPKGYGREFFDYIGAWLYRDNQWHVRAALVVMNSRYVSEEYVAHVLERLERWVHTDSPVLNAYYVQMGAAWLVSTCFIKFREVSEPWLADIDHLPDTIRKMAYSKIRDSRREKKEA
jgi:3-methyladenine DNA glycosylase AlkD